MSTANKKKESSTPDTPAAPPSDKKSDAPVAPSAIVKQGPLPNRPGEPEFKLELLPEAVTFVCTADKKPVWCDLQLKNTSVETQSFKVKCTSADVFRVQPPIGLVKKDETTTIRVWFQNKVIPEGTTKHYFAVYHLKAGEGKTVKDVWTKVAKADGVRRLSAVFTDKPSN